MTSVAVEGLPCHFPTSSYTTDFVQAPPCYDLSGACVTGVPYGVIDITGGMSYHHHQTIPDRDDIPSWSTSSIGMIQQQQETQAEDFRQFGPYTDYPQPTDVALSAATKMLQTLSEQYPQLFAAGQPLPSPHTLMALMSNMDPQLYCCFNTTNNNNNNVLTFNYNNSNRTTLYLQYSYHRYCTNSRH